MSDIRAGDRERDRTATDLGQALAQGYLPMAEYEDRWPVWPILGWGIGVVSHAIPIMAHVRS